MLFTQTVGSAIFFGCMALLFYVARILFVKVEADYEKMLHHIERQEKARMVNDDGE